MDTVQFAEFAVTVVALTALGVYLRLKWRGAEVTTHDRDPEIEDEEQ